MILHRHTQRLGFGFHTPAYPSHPQDPQDFAFWVVAEGRWRGAAELALAEVLESDIESTQGAKHEEDACVGCRVIHDCGDIGHANIGGCAIGDVALVVAGS